MKPEQIKQVTDNALGQLINALEQGQSVTLTRYLEAGSVIGRSLRIEEISPDEARELLNIMPASVANMLLDAWAAAAGQPAFVTSTVAEITGVPARTFREWATDHVAEFRS